MSDETQTAPEPTEIVLKAFRQEKAVKIQLTPDGDPETYYIITMTGAEKSRWQNGNIDRVKYDAAGKPVGVKKFDGMEAGLLHACLRDANRQVISRDVFEGWGSPILIALSKMCFEFNGLTEKAEADAKN